MFVRKRPVLRKRRRQRSRRWCGLSMKDGLQFLSSLILPLMLGVFTVVITFQQQKLARDQHLEDRNELRIQREQEWNISQIAQAAQSKALIDQYRDEVLLAYIKEIGDLLEKKNDSFMATLARVKTLNALRQLDGARQMRIISFLYEANLLNNMNKSVPLDMSTAELIDIDFRRTITSMKIEKISLAGVYLRNCTFEDMRLESITFSSAILVDVNFSNAILFNIDFSSAKLSNTKFLFTKLRNVNFRSTSLDSVSFSSAPHLFNLDFSSAERLYNVNFSSANVFNITFSSADFASVDFSSARLNKVNFSSAVFRRLHELNGFIRFNHAKMSHAIFAKCLCDNMDFSYADLRNSSFQHAILGTANFACANLQNANFTDSTITDNQLRSALSIRNAKLPNGTLGQGRNLVKNGDANCHISLIEHWHVHNGSIVIVAMKEDSNQCQFSVRPVATVAIMSQRITLVDIWDSSFWTSSTVELQAQMSSGVSVELIGRNSNGTVLNKRIANATVNKRIMKLEDMHELEVVVKFNVQQNENSWCDNIELFMDYDSTPIYED